MTPAEAHRREAPRTVGRLGIRKITGPRAYTKDTGKQSSIEAIPSRPHISLFHLLFSAHFRAPYQPLWWCHSRCSNM